MSLTTPNKETIRRLCLLHKVTFCYLQIKTNTKYVDLFTDIEDFNIDLFTQELESWCGMKFNVYNLSSNTVAIEQLKKEGKNIYPIKL